MFYRFFIEFILSCYFYIYLYYLYSLYVFTGLYLLKNTGPFLDSEAGVLFGETFFGTKGLLTLPKQVPFLTISNKNIFFESQGKRLAANVEPNKCLE